MNASPLEATLCGRMTVLGLNILDEYLGPHAADYDAHFEPIRLFEPAARGDLEAQRKLSMYCAYLVYRGLSAEAHENHTATLAEAISIGRLAAAHGEDKDKMAIAIFLAMGAIYSADYASALEWAAECIARLELLADEGHESAADLLATLAGTETPEVLKLAQIYRARFVEAKETD